MFLAAAFDQPPGGIQLLLTDRLNEKRFSRDQVVRVVLHHESAVISADLAAFLAPPAE